MWVSWGKASPFPSRVGVSWCGWAVRLHRFLFKYMAAHASWMMPTCLPADAAINHCVTGWRCPSLTSGWLRRACFLPAWQRKAVSWEGLLALEMLLWNCCKIQCCISNDLNFQCPFPHRSITKHFANYHAGTEGMYILWSSAPFSPATPQSSVLACGCLCRQQALCVLWQADTKPLERLCGVAEDFLGGRAFIVLGQIICSSLWY